VPKHGWRERVPVAFDAAFAAGIRPRRPLLCVYTFRHVTRFEPTHERGARVRIEQFFIAEVGVRDVLGHAQ
jgi:hypothetical protein